jgi:hypothetical protein
MIERIFRSIFRHTPKTLLGRWERTNHNQNKIKIDLANTDHCGTCTYSPRIPKKPDLELHELVHKKEKNKIIF